MLPATVGDDEGAVHDADANRTYRAWFVGMVARWSSRCRAWSSRCRTVVVAVAPDRARARTRGDLILSRRAGAAVASG